MKRKEALSVGEIIEDMFARTGLMTEYNKAAIAAGWEKVVGPHIAALTTRAVVKDDKLHVYISSAPLKEQLGYLRQTLTDQLNKLVGQTVIKDIVIH